MKTSATLLAFSLLSLNAFAESSITGLLDNGKSPFDVLAKAFDTSKKVIFIKAIPRCFDKNGNFVESKLKSLNELVRPETTQISFRKQTFCSTLMPHQNKPNDDHGRLFRETQEKEPKAEIILHTDPTTESEVFNTDTYDWLKSIEYTTKIDEKDLALVRKMKSGICEGDFYEERLQVGELNGEYILKISGGCLGEPTEIIYDYFIPRNPSQKR